MARAQAAVIKGTWVCQRVTGGDKCGWRNVSSRRKCVACGKPKPPRRKPAHRAVLDEMTYERFVELYGETCNICGADPGTRRLHRDHDHATGEARGVLCFRCNTALPNRVSPSWLRAAADYLERP